MKKFIKEVFKVKKNLFFPCVILRPILISIPLAIVLASAITLNHAVDTLFKLYPLMIFSSLAIVFTFVYFFRVVSLSKDEIKVIGPFSSKDSSVINEGKTLIITERAGGRISIDLFGNNGVNADLVWLKSEEGLHDFYLFKSNVVGGHGTVKRILRFFDLDKSEAERIASSEELYREFPDYDLTVSTADGMREIRIKFTRTI